MDTRLRLAVHEIVALSAAGFAVAGLTGCEEHHRHDRDDHPVVVAQPVPGDVPPVVVMDDHGFAHRGWYDQRGDWHGGYYDERHDFHDDAHDWGRGNDHDYDAHWRAHAGGNYAPLPPPGAYDRR